MAKSASASRSIVVVPLLLFVSLVPCVVAQVRAPPVFNVAQNKSIVASSTCGVDATGNTVEDEFCLLTLTSQSSSTSTVCETCQGASGPLAHPASRMVDGSQADWISPPLSRGDQYHEVSITLDLGQVFHVAYVFVHANRAPRPGQWILEKSLDNRVYTPWQYFVLNDRDCERIFKIDPDQPLTDSSPSCTDTYSAITPLNNGEIYARLLSRRPSEDSFSDSAELQDFTSARYIRFRFERVATLLGELDIPSDYADATISRRYFYSIKTIQVGGLCKCNGFASECVSRGNEELLECTCTENTCGPDCSQCCPGFNQYKWQLRTQKNNFTCEACNCFGHSESCVYNASVDASSGSLNLDGRYSGGGVCRDCRDNTAGINCDKCAPRHYRLPARSRRAPCTPCRCAGPGSRDGLCDPTTGDCACKKNVEGARCDRCKPGFFALESSNSDGCRPCGCDVDGSLVGLRECGACACKPLVASPTCERCVDGAYGLSGETLFGCELCRCDVGGAVEPFRCNANRGKCECRDGLRGKRCNLVARGSYLPSVHTNLFGEAEEGDWISFRTPFGFDDVDFPGYSGFGYVILRNNSQMSISLSFSIKKAMKYQVVIYYVLEGSTSSRIQAYFIAPGGEEQNVAISLDQSSQPRYSNLGAGEFSLTPGDWSLVVEYDGASRLLIDRVIVIPEEFYNPTNLLTNVPDMCPASADQTSSACRRYAHPDITKYLHQEATIAAGSPTLFAGQLVARMDATQNSRLGFVFSNVPAGSYAIVVSYFSSHADVQSIGIEVSGAETTGQVAVYPCAFAFGCRHVAMDRGEVLAYDVPESVSSAVTVILTLAQTADSSQSADIVAVYLIPSVEFTAAMVTPVFKCYFLNSSCSATPFEPLKNSAEMVNYYVSDDGYYFDAEGEKQSIDVSSNPIVNSRSQSTRGVAVLGQSQKSADIDVELPSPGSYNVLLHYYNPDAESVTVTLSFDDVSFNVTLPFCPDESGCRVAYPLPINSESTSSTLTIASPTKTIYIDSVSFIQSGSFDAGDYVSPQPLDVKNRFIAECSANAFAPTDNAFCTQSVASLSAIYNDGAVACDCDPQGSTSVECNQLSGECACKPDVVGLTCTRCKVGYYGFPNCLPCECTSGSVCDEVTGACVCPPNVRGRACDQCETNFWRFDATLGCVSCACDGVGSSGADCNVTTGQCACRPRYAGLKCNECAEGRYDPPTCRKCACDSTGSVGIGCNQASGACRCKTNVGGDKCAECASGTFNLTQAGCQTCGCDVEGSASRDCHPTTGECACKSGVVGRACDRCEADHYRTSNGSCAPCACNPTGSRSSTCDVDSGKCRCKKFVRGLRCDRCARGSYAFGVDADGCTSCACDALGSTGDCDVATGKCACKPGTFGDRCDQCQARHVVADEGCRPCGYCTDSIMDEMENLMVVVNGTLVNITDYSFLVAAWRRLRNIRRAFNESRRILCGLDWCGDFDAIPPPPVLVAPPPTGGSVSPLGDVLARLEILIGRIEPNTGLILRLAELKVLVDRLELRVNASLDDAIEDRNDATRVNARADALLDQTQMEDRRLAGLVNDLRDLVNKLSSDVAVRKEPLDEGRKIVKMIVQRDFDTPSNDVKALHGEAEKALDIAEDALLSAQAFLDNATLMEQSVKDWIAVLTEARKMTANVSANVNAAAASTAEAQDVLSQIEDKIANLRQMIADLRANATRAENSVKIATSQLEDARNTNGGARDDTNRMSTELQNLRQRIFDFMTELAALEVEALKAERNVSLLIGAIDGMDSTWNDARKNFNASITYIRNYHLLNVTEFLLNLTLGVNVTSNATLEAGRLNVTDIRERARRSLLASRALQQEVADCNTKLQELNSSLARIAADLESAIKLFVVVETKANSTNDSATTLVERSYDPTVVETDANAAARSAAAQTGNYTALVKRADDLRSQLKDYLTNTKPVLSLLFQAEENATIASGRAQEIPNDSQAIRNQFSDLTDRLNALDVRLIDIQEKIDRFRKHAATIDVPFNINEGANDETITLETPPSLEETAFETSVIVNVRPASLSSGLLFFAGPDDKKSATTRRRRGGLSFVDPFLAIELDNGLVKFSYSAGGVPAVARTTLQGLSTVETFEITARRLGLKAELKVQKTSAGDHSFEVFEDTAEAEAPSGSPWLAFERKSSRTFVGGIPSDYEMPNSIRPYVSSTTAPFSGCIASISVNRDFVSMTNFNNASVRIPPVCKAKAILLKNRVVSDGTLKGLYGLGYIAFDPNLVVDLSWASHTQSLRLTFSGLVTTQLAGLLFYAKGDGNVFLSLEIYNRGVRALLSTGGDAPTYEILLADVVGLVQSTPTAIIVTVDTRQFRLDAGRQSKTIRTTKGVAITSPLYLGGVPRDFVVDERVFSRASLAACFESFTVRVSGGTGAHTFALTGDDSVAIVDGSNGFGMKCFEVEKRSAYFDGTGGAIYSPMGFDSLLVFWLRPENETGFLFYQSNKEETIFYSVSLVDKKVRFYLDRTDSAAPARRFMLTTNEVNLMEKNYVVITRSGDQVSITLNDVTTTESRFHRGSIPGGQSIRDSTANTMIGRPRDDVVQLLTDRNSYFKAYEGCLGDVTFTVGLLNFGGVAQEATTSGMIIPCEAREIPTPTPTPMPTGTPTPSPTPTPTPVKVSCVGAPQVEANGYSFAPNPGSRVSFEFSDVKVVQRGFEIKFAIRTEVESATILSAVNKDQSNYIFLSLQARKLVYTFFMSSGAADQPEHAYLAELDASGIYDGQWHNVTLSRTLKGGFLAIDGSMNKGRKFSGDAKFLRLNDAFVFGDNGDLKKKHKDFRDLPDFEGCIKDVAIVSMSGGTATPVVFDDVVAEGDVSRSCYKAIDTVSDNAGFDGKSHVVIATNWNVNTGIDIKMTVRSNNRSGLLLSVGADAESTAQSSYVILEIRDGVLAFVVNNGDGEFSVTDASATSLCDGKWHDIEAKLMTTNIEVTVDGGEKSSAASSGTDGTNDSSGPLYIGGLPSGYNDANRASRHVSVPNLFGCVKDLFIDRDRSFQSLGLDGGAQLNYCVLSEP